MLAGHVTQPVLRLAQVWQDFQHTLIALRRVGDILDEAPEHGNNGLASVPALQGAIEFRHIRFRYQPDAPRCWPTSPSPLNRGSSSASRVRPAAARAP